MELFVVKMGYLPGSGKVAWFLSKVFRCFFDESNQVLDTFECICYKNIPIKYFRIQNISHIFDFHGLDPMYMSQGQK